MQAWQVARLGDPAEALALAEVGVPRPRPGLLRIRVAAAGIGLPDLLMCRGSYALAPQLPFTPGQELVGVVSAVEGESELRVGERVAAVSAFFVGHGAFAEEALAVASFALPAPEALPDAEAAGFTIPFHTAYVGLVRRGQLRAGETLLVLGGAGGTGSAALQLGRALGARVIATAGSPEKAAFCRELGALHVVDHHREDLAAAVREATQGRGADVVYDPVGGDAFRAATRCIAHEGRILVVGFASGSWAEPQSADLVNKNYSVVGVVPTHYDRDFRLRAQNELLALHRSGELRVPVHRVAPFDALPDALGELAAGGVLGKSVLSVAR